MTGAVRGAAVLDGRFTSEQLEIFGVGAAFAREYLRWAPLLRWKALRLAHNDEALASDLMQEAAIALWELDATRYGPGDGALFRTAMLRRMKDVARKEHWHVHRR